MSTLADDLDPITRLTRDLRAAARTLSEDEARFLVDRTIIMWPTRPPTVYRRPNLTS
jgi:hypothetical protein